MPRVCGWRNAVCTVQLWNPAHHWKKTVDLYPLDDLINGPRYRRLRGRSSSERRNFLYSVHTIIPSNSTTSTCTKSDKVHCIASSIRTIFVTLKCINTIARAVLFQDAAVAPLGAPTVEVIATAKTDLKAGDTIDGIGWYMTYGEAENADVTHRDRLLPMGLAEGCVLKHDIAKDQALTYDDVELPAGRKADLLRAEQDKLFFR